MSKEPEPPATPRPWYTVTEIHVPHEGPKRAEYPIYRQNGSFRCPAKAASEADAALICRAVNAWDDVLALEARIGELTRASTEKTS